jgi:hypothetical protein
MVCANCGVRGGAHYFFAMDVGCRWQKSCDVVRCAATRFFLGTLGAKIVQQQQPWTKEFVCYAVAASQAFKG